MDRLKMMESFAAVVRTGSFAQAAKTLGVSRSLITKYVIEVEARLNTRLLNRTTRNIGLTEAGQDYYQLCERILAEIALGEETVAQKNSDPRGLIRIGAPFSFGSQYFTDCLAQFSLIYPDIKLAVTLEDSSSGSVDFAHSQYDLQVRLIPLNNSNVTVRKLGTLEWAICASPDYLKRHGEPTHPNDLRTANCLIHEKLDSAGWKFSSPASVNVKVQGSFTSNSVIVLRRAVLAGVGIGQLPLYRVHRDLAEGKLKQILTDYSLPKRPIYVVYPPKKLIPQRLKHLIDHLVAWHKQQPNGR